MPPSLSASNSWQAPFWGKSSAYVGGRDPLGLQATSVATYSRLLPGITNVTNRVRYWSFYCWLIHLYSRKVHKTGYDRFIGFIRWGEFALACAIEKVAPEEGAVSGKDKARKAIQQLPLDLGKYANSNADSNDRYWKYESGAFGQYFAGIMTDLGLLEKNEYGIFVCTDKTQHEKYALQLEVSGVDLAEAFHEAIGVEIESRFLNTLEKGIASEEDLILIGKKMNLSAIQPATTEWMLIQKILTGRDLPGRKTKEQDSFFRLETINLFLDFRRLEPERGITQFPFWLEERNGLSKSGDASEVAFGWFYYTVNEHWHYAHELIFDFFLERLRSNDFTGLETFLKGFVAEIVQQALPASRYKGGISALEWLDLLESTTLDDTEESTENRAVKGFKAIFNLYKKYKDRIDEFIIFGQRLGIERHGDFGHGLRHIGEHLHSPLEAFFEWHVLRQIINRHLFVAMEKLATTGVNTQKFRLEEQVLYFINNISVGYTNPRIYQLGLFLRDLKVLDQLFSPSDLADDFAEFHKQSLP